jgi:hypothetical protein
MSDNKKIKIVEENLGRPNNNSYLNHHKESFLFKVKGQTNSQKDKKLDAKELISQNHIVNQDGLSFFLKDQKGKNFVVELLETRYLEGEVLHQKEIENQRLLLKEADQKFDEKSSELVFKNYYFSQNSTFGELCQLLKILGPHHNLIKDIERLLKEKNKKSEAAFKVAMSVAEIEKEIKEKSIAGKDMPDTDSLTKALIELEKLLAKDLEKFFAIISDQDLFQLHNEELIMLNEEVEKNPQTIKNFIAEEIDPSRDQTKLLLELSKAQLILRIANLNLSKNLNSLEKIARENPALYRSFKDSSKEELEQIKTLSISRNKALFCCLNKDHKDILSTKVKQNMKKSYQEARKDKNLASPIVKAKNHFFKQI